MNDTHRVVDECPGLLEAMVRDAASQPGIYQPGPFWKTKTRAAVRQIERHGLSGFRGYESGVGTSFADNVFVDMRTALDAGRGRPLKFLFERVFPFSTIMSGQVALTRGYSQDATRLDHSPRRRECRDPWSPHQVRNARFEFWLLGWPIATRSDPERDEASRISLFVSGG